MNSIKKAALGLFALAAMSTASLGAAAPASATVLTLGNSASSTTNLYAFHRTDCTGDYDLVRPGELAQHIGRTGSVLILPGQHGTASPFYVIHEKNSTWCWKTPTAVATSVYLTGGRGGSWFSPKNSNF